MAPQITCGTGPTIALLGVQLSLHIQAEGWKFISPNLLNRCFDEGKVVRVDSDGPVKYDEETGDFQALSSKELEAPGFIGKEMKFATLVPPFDPEEETISTEKIDYDLTSISSTGEFQYRDCTAQILARTFTNSRGYFTVAETMKHVVEFERAVRPLIPDLDHIFFEGLGQHSQNFFSTYYGMKELQGNLKKLEGTYYAFWGS